MNKTKSISISEKCQEMISQLKEKYGYPTDSSVLMTGLVELYRKTFKNKK